MHVKTTGDIQEKLKRLFAVPRDRKGEFRPLDKIYPVVFFDGIVFGLAYAQFAVFFEARFVA